MRLRSDCVGVGLLAKGINDNACWLNKHSDLEYFANKLAPAVALKRAALAAL